MWFSSFLREAMTLGQFLYFKNKYNTRSVLFLLISLKLGLYAPNFGSNFAEWSDFISEVEEIEDSKPSKPSQPRNTFY